MSARTALISLRQILGHQKNFYFAPPVVGGLASPLLQPRYNIHYRPQLQDLIEEVDLLLNFLDNSSTYEARQVAELETKIRDAAYRAELHINIHGIPDHNMINSDDIFSFYSIFIVFSPFLASLDVMPFILVEAIICIINAAFLYLWVREKCGFPTRKASQEWRRLFYEFRIMAEEVNRTEESSSSSSSSSSTSALISLRHILDSIILDDSGYNTHHLKSLQEKVTFLLENNAAASSSSTCTQNLGAKMRDAVYKAKRALIEFRLPRKSGLIFDWRRFSTLLDVLLLVSPFSLFMLSRLVYYVGVIPYYLRIIPEIMPTRLEMLGQICISFASYMCSVVIVLALLPFKYNYKVPKNQELAHLVDDFDIIVRDAIKIKEECEETADLSTPASPRQDLGGSGRDVVVGLERDIEEIKGCLFQVSSKKLEVVSIVGMGGIGKTTLAHKVYHDPHIVNWFDVRAWTAVSQWNTLPHVLLSLLDSAHMLTQEEMRQDSDQELGVHLHKYLSGRRYLIVVDDVWDTEISDFLLRHFPENYNHSRVLLTSRLPNVVSHLNSSSRLHHMQCLNENHSWDLLCAEVFRAEGCPVELESIGRKIARRCGGLPLAIVVIGGLLYKDIQVDVWRDVAEKLEKSEVHDIKERCLDILGLSYNHLPPHLRPCFLYTGGFLAHSEIPISKIIHLWIAEGFLRPYESKEKTLEDVAEGYIRDLVDRNLISVSKWSCDGKIRTCGMHDLLRDVCVENAREEKFHRVVVSGGYVVTGEGPNESPRSLSIHPNAQQVDDINGYLDSVNLRVVNVPGATFHEFPRQITELVSLRYLAFRYDGSVRIPPSIYKLQYLETLVLHHTSFGKNSFLPSSIWRMPNLRHIHVKPGCYMFKPLGHQFDFFHPTNLQTLVGIRNFKWTRAIIEKLPNLKKLGILYDFSSPANWSTYQLYNLVHLEKLEGLKINVKYDDLGSAMPHDPSKLAFPKKLKKLSLSGCRIPWESMTAIGALPNLEALKLRCKAFCGPSWETVEGEFPRLMFLLLEEMSFTTWVTEESHFPRLQRLVLRSCVMLKEIPSSIGEIPSLELIELVDCHDSAVASAEYIQEEQESMGNEVLKVNIEQRGREVDGMNNGNVKARGREPGVFEVLDDAMDSTQYEMLLSVRLMAISLVSMLATVLVSLFKLFSFLSRVWGLEFIP